VPDRIVGDYNRLRQILNNLLGNALKFTQKGSVRLEIELVESDARSVTLRFSVSDSGVGMAPETLRSLFTPFYQADASTTRRFGGTGLGLSICKRLAELMGGNITVESKLEQGSRFSLTLPFLAVPSAEAAPAPVAVKPVDLPKHAHVLLVEDNRINQMVASQMLGKMGARVTVAENGREAIDMLARLHFDLIFMDCQMPVMDGYETTRQIRAGAAGTGKTAIRIVATTANAMRGDREKCLEAGMDDYIAKPFSFDDLTTKLVQGLPDRNLGV
jgi:CheY-like chemotaxis protein